MTKRVAWFDRRWAFDFPVGNYTDILERLRGTPARLEERLNGTPAALLTRREGDRWSIQENVGHLGDLEHLWTTRTSQLLAGSVDLQPADTTNARTHAARHNDSSLRDVLARFRQARCAWVATLDALAPEDFARAAHHPRLKHSMRLVDLCVFVADHDDHHLSRIGVLLRV